MSDLTDLMENSIPVHMALIMRNTGSVCHRSEDDVYTDIPRVLVMGVIIDAAFAEHVDKERIVTGQLIFVPDKIEITKAYPGWQMQDILAEGDWPVVKPEDKVTCTKITTPDPQPAATEDDDD